MFRKYSNRLIVLRGNSGSGKSTVAKEVREQAKKLNKIALVEQDYLRRTVLKERETEGENNIGLIKEVVEYALSHGYDVILEGIFYSGRYTTMLKKLLKMAPRHFVYYLDVSLEETLQRHKSKPDSHEFGEKELRSWYKDKDLLMIDGEIIIGETSKLQKTVRRIIEDTGI